MIYTESFSYRICIIILNILSIIGCSMLIWTFMRVKRLSQNPGKIIMRISIIQMAYTILLLLSQFYFSSSKEAQNQQEVASFKIGNTACKYLGLLALIFSALFDIYNFYLISYLCLMVIQQNSINLFGRYFPVLELMGLVMVFIYALCSYHYYYDTENPIYIGNLGNCAISGHVDNYANTILVGIIFIMIIGTFFKFDRLKFQISIFDIEQSKFQVKYLVRFLVNNVFYVLVFMIMRLMPVIFRNGSEDNNYYQEVELTFTSLAGLLLFIIRAFDPIISKYLRQLFCCYQSEKRLAKIVKFNDNLLEPYDTLLNKDSQREGSSIQTLEITYVQSQNILNQSDKIKGSLILQSAYNNRVKKSQVFALIQTIKHIIQTEVQIGQQRKVQAFDFTHLKHRPLSLKYSLRKIELSLNKKNSTQSSQYLESSNCSSNSSAILEDLVQNYDGNLPVRVNCFYYAYNQMQSFLHGMSNITVEQVLHSMSLKSNHDKLCAFENDGGNRYITQDGLISLELISRGQKEKLTRGGGLYQLYRGWQDVYTDEERNGAIHLPILLGLMMIQLDNRNFNVVLRMNRVQVEYPVSELSWQKQGWKKSFEKQNIIGWIEVSSTQVVTRFLASSVVDHRFSFALEERDFRLNQYDQILLMDNLQKDLLYMQNVGTGLVLSMVYFKYSAKRLELLIQKEGSQIMDPNTLENNSYDILLMRKKDSIAIRKYELNSKVGYVRVFFDLIFQQEIEDVKENREQEIQDLINRLSDII